LKCVWTVFVVCGVVIVQNNQKITTASLYVASWGIWMCYIISDG